MTACADDHIELFIIILIIIMRFTLIKFFCTKDIGLCNISAMNSLKITIAVLYILFSCVLTFSQMFPTMFNPEKCVILLNDTSVWFGRLSMASYNL